MEEESLAWKYFDLLYKATKEIPESYIYSINIHKKRVIPQLERVFAYELYHRWSTYANIGDNNEVDCNNKVVINAEPSKNIISNIHGKRKLKLVEPDLVLHGGQNNYENQLIVCEIKRSEGITTDKIMNDLVKFLFFFDKDNFSGHPYEMAVFILIKSTINRLYNLLSEENISKWLESKKRQERNRSFQQLEENKEKIMCIVKDSTSTESIKLSDILKNKGL